MSTITRRGRIANGDWEKHKETIKRLYLEEDRELDGPQGVIELMKAHHDFDASKSQYEGRFRKWVFRKNLKSDEWHTVYSILERRKREGKRSEILLSGTRVTENRVCKEAHRHRCDLRSLPVIAGVLPNGVTIRSPQSVPATIQQNSGQIDSYSPLGYEGTDRGSGRARVTHVNKHELPITPPENEIDSNFLPTANSLDSWLGDDEVCSWSRFDANLAHTKISNIDLRLKTTSFAMSSGESTSITKLTLDDLAFPPAFFEIVENVFNPRRPSNWTNFDVKLLWGTRFEAGPGSYASQYEASNSTLRRLLFFVLTNSFVANELPVAFVELMATQMLHISTSAFERVLRTIPLPYRVALCEGAMRMALLSGHVALVDSLVKKGQQVPRILAKPGSNWRYTPMKIAIQRGHTALVKYLIERISATANGTNLLQEVLQLDPTPKEIFTLLLQAGAVIGPHPFSSFRIMSKDPQLVDIYLMNVSKKRYQEAHDKEVLDDLLSYFEDHDTHEMILKTYGESFKESEAALDYIGHRAAYRGLQTTLQLVLDTGWTATTCAVVAAIDANCLPSVKKLINAGAGFRCVSACERGSAVLRPEHSDIRFPFKHPNSEAYERRNPLSAAIRTQNEEILKFLRESGAWEKSKIGPGPVILAAIEAGDIRSFNEAFDMYSRFAGDVYHFAHLEYSLEMAIQERQEEIAYRILNLGFGPTASMLETAILTKQQNLAFFFMDLGATITSEVLRAALIVDDRRLLRLLIPNRVPIGDCFFDGRRRLNPLSWAILKRNHGLAETLLSWGASFVFIKPKDDFGIFMTPLAAAIETGNIFWTTRALEDGADPCDSYALELAANKGIEMVELIIQAYQRMYPQSRGLRGYNCRALGYAICQSDLPMVNLLAPFTDLSVDQFDSPLRYAIATQNTDILRILLEAGGNPNGIVDDRPSIPPTTALMFAIEIHHLPSVKLLCDYGGEVNSLARFGILRTPLQLAVEKGQHDIVQYLLDQNADVNANPALKGGATALQLAAIKGDMPLATLLLAHKADINASGSQRNGRTAFEGAAEHGRLDMLLFLYQHYVDIVSDGGTQYERALHFAEENEQHAAKIIVEMLYRASLARRNQTAMNEGLMADTMPSPVW